MIAVHTLTAAARGILREFAHPRGIERIDATIEKLSPKNQKTLRHAINEAQNFFKHADIDPTSKLKFPYGATQFLLSEAALICHALSARPSPEVTVMVTWCAMKFPELCNRADPRFDTFLKLAKGINPDDFDWTLATIDGLNRKGQMTK